MSKKPKPGRHSANDRHHQNDRSDANRRPASKPAAKPGTGANSAKPTPPAIPAPPQVPAPPAKPGAAKNSSTPQKPTDSAASKSLEKPAVAGAAQKPAVSPAPEKPAVGKAPEKPAVGKAPEKPAVEKAPEKPAVTPAPEKKAISPAAPQTSPQTEAQTSPQTETQSSPRENPNPTTSPATPTQTSPETTTSPQKTPAPYRLPAAVQTPRVTVTEVRPTVEESRWPAKAAVREHFPVKASVFIDGHGAFGADAVLLRPKLEAHRGAKGYDLYADWRDDPENVPNPLDPQQWEVVDRARMFEVGTGLSQFEGWLTAGTQPGRYAFAIETWADPYLTWLHDATVKVEAGIDVELMLEEGARLLERAINATALGADLETCGPQAQLPEADRMVLQGAVAGLRDTRHKGHLRLAAATSDLVRSIMAETPLKDLNSRTRLFGLRVDRERSLVGAWYEIFPRSVGAYLDEDGVLHPGTLRSAAQILPDVAADGFDVVYLTPISPIGHSFRKGKNNSLQPGPDDPGSPWAIGDETGGHDAVHPELGTIEDFDYFVARARENGLEVALDLAWQCSPDHPWVKQHPQWFTTRADATIAYAENPPKKYQDIYPLNFDNDPDGLYQAIRAVCQHWIDHGVTIFRMDNPHTKPVRFWQRLAADLHREHPEVVMLAEAFTKPAMMRGLAQAGFHLSYSYFTWRNTKEELMEFLGEVSYDTAHVLRPALFPMTPDILTEYLTQGIEAFRVRALLAATAAPTWGILMGAWEFCEHVQRPGAEEGIDNQKYEIKVYDWGARDKFGLAGFNRRLNQVRQAHPALRQLRNIRFHETDNENLLVFSKHTPAPATQEGRDDTVLVVVNLDPKNVQSGWVTLDIPSLGLDFSADYHADLERGNPDHRNDLSPTAAGGNADLDPNRRADLDPEKPLLWVRDELNGGEYQWSTRNYIELNPYDKPGHVFTVLPLKTIAGHGN